MVKRIIVSLLLFLVATISRAGINRYSMKLEGAQITTGTTLELKDDEFDNMTTNAATWFTQFKNVSSSHRAHLRYTGANKLYFGSAWFVEVILQIDAFDQLGNVIPTQQCTLRVNYNPAAQTSYTDVSTYSAPNGLYIKTTVLSINSTFGSTLPADIMLENEIEVDRYMYFDPSYVPLFQKSASATEIEYFWDYNLGAVEYDLEWVFKSQYAPGALVDFGDATRITTTNQNYKFNLVFDDGYIYARLRGVGIDFATGQKRVEGDWQYLTLSTVSNYHELNWTYNATYAEQGKRKEVMTYFDGSQRYRQSVTINNSDNVSIVAEKFYDYEGRSAVQTLPAPTLGMSNTLKFYEDCSLADGTGGEMYRKKFFDNSNLVLPGTCVTSAAPMEDDPAGVTGGNSTSANLGASYYFSENNIAALANDYSATIPDANKYPFTQTIYNSKGEISMSSGVGPTHIIGSNHETKYFNATASQEKLDRLFGNEVGFADHYREKVAIDPNGQVSVSYEDLSGKVIATALRGNSPSNLVELNSDLYSGETLDDEPFMNSEIMKEDFTSQNQLSNGSFVIQKDFMVTDVATTYSFKYEVTPQTFHALCNNTDYPCKYILQINIKDACNNPIPGSNFVVSPSALCSTNCLNSPISIDGTTVTQVILTFDINFPNPGVYKIEKTLSLDPIALQQYVTSYQNDLNDPAKNTCITSVDDLENQYEANNDPSECMDCKSACNYFANQVKPTTWDLGLDYIDDAGNVFHTMNAYLGYCGGQCSENTEKADCDGLLDALKADMSPGGQYFEYNFVNKSFFIGLNFYSFANTNYIDALAYINGQVTFTNNFQNYINVNCSTGVTVPLVNLYSWLVANWDDCYADFFVQFHPEYCRYQRCVALNDSYNYNVLLLSLNYTQATGSIISPYTTPLLSPAPTNVCGSGDGLSIAQNDPSPAISGLQAQITNCTYCNNMFPYPTTGAVCSGSSNIGMWDYAKYFPVGASTNADQWTNFRALYMSIKEQYFENPYCPSSCGSGCTALTDNSAPPDFKTDIPSNNGVAGVTACTCSSLGGGFLTLQLDQMVINDPNPLPGFNNIHSSGSSSNTPSYAASPCTMTSGVLHINDAPDGLADPSNSSSCNTVPQSTTNAIISTLTAHNPIPTGSCGYVFFANVPTVYSSSPPNTVPLSPSLIQISTPIIMPSGWCNNATYFGQLQNSVNTFVSNPDFTMSGIIVGASCAGSAYNIVADPSLGVLANNVIITSVEICPDGSGGYVVHQDCYDPMVGGTTNCTTEVVTTVDCVCPMLDNYFGSYNAVDGSGNFYVNHTTYPTWQDYAASDLIAVNNITFPTASTPPYNNKTDLANAISYWYGWCHTANAYQIVDQSPYELDANEEIAATSGNINHPVPNEIKCDPDEPCAQQGIDESDFFAQEDHDSQVALAVANFKDDYIKVCMSNLSELFNVQYSEKEYHYTLYYYDRAGNLVRTVPPKAVDRISPLALYVSGSAQTKVDFRRQADKDPTFTSPTLFIYTHHSRIGQLSNGVGNAPNLLVTNYKYSTLEQLLQQETPDGGLSKFYFNDVGQLRFSQNAKQRVALCNINNPNACFGHYTYNIYDGQGRIIEVGENDQCHSYVVHTGGPGGGVLNDVDDPFYTMVNDPTFPTAPGIEVTKTYYDLPLLNNDVQYQFTATSQDLLRKRVSSITLEATEDADDNTYNSASHYSYDVHGHIKELVQENLLMQTPGGTHNLGSQQYKKFVYQYDLLSGNVKQIMYQPFQLDQLYHKYFYDANNRLTNAISSSDNIHWEQDARYFYHTHDVLYRAEIGNEKVQGMDYVLTLHGMIKGLNSNSLDQSGANTDFAFDGYSNNIYMVAQKDIHSNVAKDVFGYSLEYYNNDYLSIDNNNIGANITGNISSSGLYAASSDVFNGNIKGMIMAICKPNGSGYPQQLNTVARFFSYDQLNRIKAVDAYSTATGFFPAGSSVHTHPSKEDYYEGFWYDASGNIKHAERNGNGGFSANVMDKLDYNYGTSNVDYFNSNKLSYVSDAASSTFVGDIKNQSTANYGYDEAGELKQDLQEDIDPSQGGSVTWTIYGKIKRITRNNTSLKSDMEFYYDPAGKRIAKIVKPRNGSGISSYRQWVYTFYAYDGNENLIATYNYSLNSLDLPEINLGEQHIYGAKRLGIISRSINIQNPSINQINVYDQVKGSKYYELTNHLGNVNVVVSDRKLQYSSSGIYADYCLADVRSATDFYMFGATMADRQYHADSYRFGYNGKENDNESKDIVGSQQDYGMRIYDPRLGRFLSGDPLEKKYPWYSPYSFSANNPIKFIDLDGSEPEDSPEEWLLTKGSKDYGDYYHTGGNLLRVNDKTTAEKYWVMKYSNGNGQFAFRWWNRLADKWQSFPPTGYTNNFLQIPSKDRDLNSAGLIALADFLEKAFVGMAVVGISAPVIAVAAPVVGAEGSLILAEGGAAFNTTVGTGLVAAGEGYLGTAAIRGSIDISAQMVAYGGNWKRLDVADATYAALLTPVGSAIFGGLTDYKPFDAKDPSFKVMGLGAGNKSVDAAAMDFSLKLLFGGAGLLKPINGLSGQIGAPSLVPVIGAPFNLGGKMIGEEVKEAKSAGAAPGDSNVPH